GATCCCGGGGLLAFGISNFTACVMIGSVMMSITSSTSITSMSGVVLMSHISSSAFVPIAIAMSVSLQQRSVLHPEELRQRVLVGLGDEAHLHHPTALDRKEHPADR